MEFASVTETWLRADDAAWVDCSRFNTDGYKMLTYNRQVRTGGGIALIYKDKHIAEIKENPWPGIYDAQHPNNSQWLSDHYIVKGHVVIPRIATSTHSVKSRKIKGININSFMDDINTENIVLSNIDEAVRMLDLELLRVLDKHAPMKEMRVTDRKKEIWFDDHIKNPEKVCKEQGGSLEPV